MIDRLRLEKLQNRAVRPGVIQGRLEEMSILDLMQSLEMGQKSCQLTIRHDGQACETVFLLGAVRRREARLRRKARPPSFEVVRWPAGEFEINFNALPTRTTISRTTTGLLMEALRLMDEGQRDAADESVEATNQIARLRTIHARHRSHNQRLRRRRKSRGPFRPSGHRAVQESRLGIASSGVRADDRAAIETFLKETADSHAADVILTTGGTGLGPRDVTPEATVAVVERLIPGFPEQMRAAGAAEDSAGDPVARGGGIRGKTIIINLPGSPRGAVESLDVIADLLPHAIDILHGARHDP